MYSSLLLQIVIWVLQVMNKVTGTHQVTSPKASSVTKSAVVIKCSNSQQISYKILPNAKVAAYGLT